ncbi:MAG: DUF3426 domain-containing protein [Reyranellaceae bacterium]
MIVTCPNCSARFMVDASALGPTGRQVRCGRCKEAWFQGPAEPDALRLEETVPEFIIRPRTPGSNLPALKPPPRRNLRSFGWVLLMLLLIGALAVAWYNRDTLAARVKGLDSLIDGIFGPGTLGTGAVLEIPPERIDFTREGTALVVKGIIVNASDTEREVPPLELILGAARGGTVGTHSFTAKSPRIAAKGTIEYETRIENVPAAAETMTVRFAGKP